jgi:hypothetical protein
MDSHYDLTMKARAAAKDDPPRRYFAYSTILDPEAFEVWRREHGYTFFHLPEGELAEALDLQLVFDFPSRWWGGRAAGLADKPGASVHGRLFSIAGEDWPIVRHKEGAVTQMSVERTVRVRSGNETVEALAFTTAPARASTDGPISARFVEAFLRGGRAAGLPAAYLEAIAKTV